VGDGRLLGLIDRLLASGAGVLDGEAEPGYFAGDDLFAVLRPRGLPIGNLTSQFFANVLLDPIDHLVKETLRAPGYVRYCDDLVVFGDVWRSCSATGGNWSGGWRECGCACTRTRRKCGRAGAA
jgi:hypothetical protein